MSIYYDRPYLAGLWIVGIGLNDKQQELFQKLMPRQNSEFIPWAPLQMPEELKRLASQGYAEDVYQARPCFMNLTLCLRAMINLTRNLRPSAQLSPRPKYHLLCQNRIESDEDLVRLGNQILAANDDISLSQVFDLAPREGWTLLSFDADPKLVGRLARKVVTVGNTPECDVDLSKYNQKDALVAAQAIFK